MSVRRKWGIVPGMRKASVSLHLVLALVSSLVVMSLGITGAIMAFEPEIDHWQHRALMDVIPSGQAHTLVEIRDAVLARYPGEKVTLFQIGATRARAYGVGTAHGTVFVNPYTRSR